MSDKLQLKGNVIVTDPEIDDWFEFETKVLKVIKNNPFHTIDAVCEVKSYEKQGIIDSHKITGKMCVWSAFAKNARQLSNDYHSYAMSCTVMLRVGKKGKSAQRAFDDENLNLFSTIKEETPLGVYEREKKIVDEALEIYKKTTEMGNEDSENDTIIDNSEGSGLLENFIADSAS